MANQDRPQVVVITGASAGVGRATARNLRDMALASDSCARTGGA